MCPLYYCYLKNRSSRIISHIYPRPQLSYQNGPRALSTPSPPLISENTAAPLHTLLIPTGFCSIISPSSPLANRLFYTSLVKQLRFQCCLHGFHQSLLYALLNCTFLTCIVNYFYSHETYTSPEGEIVSAFFKTSTETCTCGYFVRPNILSLVY